MSRRCAALLAGAMLCAGLGMAQTKRALLVGIDLYQPADTTPQCPKDDAGHCHVGRWALETFGNLSGSVNDAELMASVLISAKYGFAPADVRLLVDPDPSHPPLAPPPGVVVLPAVGTTRAGILAAMQKYLVDEPRPGDTVVFYYAGHGSLQFNSLGHKLTVTVDVPGSDPVKQQVVPVDSTIVPSDAWTGVMDVRDHEMTKIFNAALDKGVRLTAIFDSCHSGQITRGAKHHSRALLFDDRDVKDASQPAPPAAHAQNAAVVLSAAQQDQEAGEDPFPDWNHAGVTVEHGDFTYALAQALEDLPADVPAAAVFRRVQAVMENAGDVGQNSELDASTGRKQEPLLGPPGVDGARTNLNGEKWAAVVSTDDSGVSLDIGLLSNVGVGSVLVPAAGVANVQLTVTALSGADRSLAAVIPASAVVNPGDLFVVKSLVRPDAPALPVWMAPANLTQAQVLAEAQEVQAAGVVSVSDPADEGWTDRLRWNGSAWMLEHAQQPPVSLGAHITVRALKKRLKPGSKVWVDIPAPQELAEQLNVNGQRVRAVSSATAAEYVLAGSLGANGPQYAWFHRSESMAGPAVRAAPDHSPGCSTTSNFPLRSEWQTVGDANSMTQTAAVLNNAALALDNDYVWMTRAATPDVASGDAYYRLEILRAADQSVVAPGGVLHAGEPVELVLHSDQAVNGPRWVYVLDIDCHGAVNLVYPATLPGKAFPDQGDNDGSGAETIVLGRPPIGEPFGNETLLLLSSSTPLSDPLVLDAKGAGTRGDAVWGLDKVTFRSVPAK